MAGRVWQSIVLLAALAPAAFAATTCGDGSQCPESTPCCSQYGECGVGAYCLGGCDPVNSFSLDACVPAPVCESKSFTFDNLDGMVSNTKYLGDASTADWVYSGTPLSHNGSVLLTMAEGTVGTLLASTHYIWYGKVTGKFSTSAGAGVVTAFILLGDSKDEIDFEFVGVELSIAQTNFYSQGVTDYNNGENATGLSDVHANMHTYELDWTYDNITWSIDGNVVRTLNREDTWNATANRYSYPQTPSRLQLSLWPGGLSTNGQGTIDWAGGLVTWDSPYMTNGYYYAMFDEVDIQCYDPPSGTQENGTKSYIYTDKAMTNNTVEITNDNTVLKSFLGSGLNMSAGSASASASGSAATSDAPTVPGLTGSGSGADGQRGSGDSSSSSADSSSTATATGSASTGFVQGDGGSKSGADQFGGNSESLLRGSLFAVVVAMVGLCVL
ncbi:putative glycosidase CRH2 [Elasticomyces elasticus]|uniref:Crh-like protein n=1 Tax=Exophiala sideris TaxID=1016849 RepID=A0ABR0IZD5_9EURO|nr:putative glycosidase CRH2 [Elasticomyces elasticus]KAK5022885.1 putative glycosidase CRH2 [Exophiala sideris]KAK5023966.1 putative glycosidase CRH2 [Exophiala sideris]KAK5052371.1 putative glycosidase CRH2 [Exophiala sideris]KAK5176280.1 putative glycosidase CRH2 [Eurotiomycetes sp. CCFEE 6388]